MPNPFDDLVGKAPAARGRNPFDDLISAGRPSDPYETKLSSSDEAKFQHWKSRYAPRDSGADYDLRGAFKAGLKPAPNGHWPDTFKKPNHPTFSNESIYAKDRPELAGRWRGETYIPPAERVEPGVLHGMTPAADPIDAVISAMTGGIAGALESLGAEFATTKAQERARGSMVQHALGLGIPLAVGALLRRLPQPPVASRPTLARARKPTGPVIPPLRPPDAARALPAPGRAGLLGVVEPELPAVLRRRPEPTVRVRPLYGRTEPTEPRPRPSGPARLGVSKPQLPARLPRSTKRPTAVVGRPVFAPGVTPRAPRVRAPQLALPSLRDVEQIQARSGVDLLDTLSRYIKSRDRTIPMSRAREAFVDSPPIHRSVFEDAGIRTAEFDELVRRGTVERLPDGRYRMRPFDIEDIREMERRFGSDRPRERTAAGSKFSPELRQRIIDQETSVIEEDVFRQGYRRRRRWKDIAQRHEAIFAHKLRLLKQSPEVETQFGMGRFVGQKSRRIVYVELDADGRRIALPLSRIFLRNPT